MGDLMRDLGADWDAEEEKEAARAGPARVEPCVAVCGQYRGKSCRLN